MNIEKSSATLVTSLLNGERDAPLLRTDLPVIERQRLVVITDCACSAGISLSIGLELAANRIQT
jgi:hypothetical protein